MKRKAKIYLSSLSGLIIVGSVLGSTLPIYLNKNDQVKSDSTNNTTNNINHTITPDSSLHPYATSGPVFMNKPANCSLNNVLLQQSANNSNEYAIWSDQLNQPNVDISLNSNIKSSSDAPISYNYYATNTKPSNMQHPSGGVLIVSNSSSSTLVLNKLDISSYKYWYIVATQTVNGITYTLSTNAIYFQIQTGPITFDFALSKTTNPISNELVSGFPTLSISNVSLSSSLKQGGTYTYSFYGSNQDNLYVTNNLLKSSTNNTYTLNQNQFRCNYKYYFAQVKYTFNNQSYIANSTWVANNNVNLTSSNQTPINNVILTINKTNNANVSLDQTNGFPKLNVNVSSSLDSPSTTTNYVWYASNSNSNLLGIKISGANNASSFTLTKTQINWLKENNLNYIFCNVYQTNQSQTYKYSSNVVQINISNDYSPLNTTGASSNALGNNETPSSNQTPSSKTNNSGSNTKNQEQPTVNNLQTNLYLNHTLNLNNIAYTNNTYISGFANELNKLYSNNLISSLFTSNYNAKDMSISDLVYNSAYSELLSFEFKNNSSIPVTIYNVSGGDLIYSIAPNKEVEVNLQQSNNVVLISNNLNDSTKNSFTYNLQAMYESGNFEQVTNYYKATEYLANGYGYLYPILWNQDNDNCLKYNFGQARYYWNSAKTGPSYIYTMNQTNWKAYISSGDSDQTIYMTYIAGMLGFNNNILNELNAYSGYVPTNNNNNTLIITKVEVNNTWYSVNFVLNGGNKFYLG